MEDRDYAVALGAGSLLLGDYLAQLEEAAAQAERVRAWIPDRAVEHAEKISRPVTDRRAKRAERMRRVLDEKRSELEAVVGASDVDAAQVLSQAAAGWDRDERARLLVDLEFSDPFLPYSLKHSSKDLHQGLSQVAGAIGARGQVLEEIRKARRSAQRAHRNRRWTRIGAIGLAAGAALGLVAWMAAPLIGTALGTAAGLSGAAATAHGLALLGGGSLAAGGFGMAGGMWIVAGTGAAVGVLGGSSSSLFYELGAAETRGELIKLQVTFRLAVLGGQAQQAKAQEIIKGLAQRQDELEQLLARERELNDDNAARVQVLAEKLEAVAASLKWMREQRVNANG